MKVWALWCGRSEDMKLRALYESHEDALLEKDQLMEKPSDRACSIIGMETIPPRAHAEEKPAEEPRLPLVEHKADAWGCCVVCCEADEGDNVHVKFPCEAYRATHEPQPASALLPMQHGFYACYHRDKCLEFIVDSHDRCHYRMANSKLCGQPRAAHEPKEEKP